MGDIMKWLLPNLWAGLAISTAAGFTIAAIMTYLAHRLRKLNNINDSALRAAMHERQRLLLSCGDAKALADLAIQRHMDDTVFLRRLRAQPCYETLYPHFSEPLRRQIAHELDDPDRRKILAAACREDIERLECELLVAPAMLG
jgi:hypothetical protein